MRVLLISQWYKPIKSPVKRMVRIAEFLAQNHEVTVLTSLPSYPTGILPPKYRHKLWVKEKDGPIEIIRVWDFPTPNRGLIRRSLNHFVFLTASCLAVLAMKPFEMVIVSSPNFFSGLAGILAAKLGQGNFIFDVRDLWPDSATELGYLGSRPLIKILKRLEKIYYLRAKKIFTATAEIQQTIIKMGIPENKVIPLSNTVDINFFKPQEISRKNFGFKNADFLVIYVGSLTKVQNLQTVLEAAASLKKYPRIKFLMVGEGEDKENLINQAKKLGLSNIIFIDGQSSEQIVKLINAANVGLISLTENKFFSDNALPTKTSEYLGCGKPIIACAGKNLKELIEKNQAGKVVPPGASHRLAEEILKLYHHPEILKKYSRNARALAVKEFSDSKFYRVLEKNLPAGRQA